MSVKKKSIRVVGYGELAGSVRERLERVRRAFEGAASEASKREALSKLELGRPA